MAVVTVVDQVAVACLGVDEEQEVLARSLQPGYGLGHRQADMLLTVTDGPIGPSRPVRG